MCRQWPWYKWHPGVVGAPALAVSGCVAGRLRLGRQDPNFSLGFLGLGTVHTYILWLVWLNMDSPPRATSAKIPSLDQRLVREDAHTRSLHAHG